MLNFSKPAIPKQPNTTQVNESYIVSLITKSLPKYPVIKSSSAKSTITKNAINPTKLGLKIQFEPLGGGLEPDVKSKLEVALQEKLNMSLQQYDIQVSKDTDVPRPDVIGFFIPLAQLKNLIVKSLTGQKVDAPDVKAPEPEGEEQEINEMVLNEMRVRDLNEISKVVMKEDFYAFINAGNNVLRSLEESGRSVSEAKKYLAYLVKHNIM